MPHAQDFFVYIMASESKVVYIGITNDLERRTKEHKLHYNSGFTHRYHVTKLVYFETFDNPSDAIAREKVLKGWRRDRKIRLIESINPQWYDLGYIDQADFSSIKQSMGQGPSSRACGIQDDSSDR